MMRITPLAEVPSHVRREASAIHEAGHALVAILLKRRVTGAMLRKPNGWSGETQFEDEPEVVLNPNDKEGWAIFENAIRVLLAGQVSEAVFWKKMASQYQLDINSQREDDAEIDSMMDGIGMNSEERPKFIRHCIDAVEKMINHPHSQGAIEEIAEKLCTNYYIGRTELDEILRKFGLID